jgi:hypothetical protein
MLVLEIHHTVKFGSVNSSENSNFENGAIYRTRATLHSPDIYGEKLKTGVVWAPARKAIFNETWY